MTDANPVNTDVSTDEEIVSDDDVTYCRQADCDEIAIRLGLCWGHCKQLQRTGHITPIDREKLSVEDRALSAGAKWLNASSEDDDEAGQLRKNALAEFQRLGRREQANATRTAMADARARGVRLGRPPVPITAAVVRRLMRLSKSTTVVAAVLGVSPSLVRRRLKVKP